MFIVMMNGHVACLKTTIARKLSEKLSLQLIETNKFGKVIGEGNNMEFSKRGARYQKLFEFANATLAKGHSVVLDGTFSMVSWRKRIYALAERYSVDGFVIIRCTCRDAKVIKSRLECRRQNPQFPESEVHHFQNYLQSVGEDEKPYSDAMGSGKLPCIIEVESANLQVKRVLNSSETGEKIKATLQDAAKEILFNPNSTGL